MAATGICCTSILILLLYMYICVFVYIYRERQRLYDCFVSHAQLVVAIIIVFTKWICFYDISLPPVSPSLYLSSSTLCSVNQTKFNFMFAYLYMPEHQKKKKKQKKTHSEFTWISISSQAYFFSSYLVCMGAQKGQKQEQ